MVEAIKVIQTIAMIAIPLLSAIVSAFYWMHKRLTEMERSAEEARGAIYGMDRDPLHVGLAREVNELKSEVERIKKRVDELKKKNERD